MHNIEFERKFRLKPGALQALLALVHEHREIRQGYFMEDDERCVRIRSTSPGQPGLSAEAPRWLMTCKVKTGDVGKVREEEFAMPAENGVALFELCRSRVHKRRHVLTVGEFTWEIDLFLDHNQGLVLAEVELADDAQSARLSAALPDWVDHEVTGDPRYFNTWLASNTLTL